MDLYLENSRTMLQIHFIYISAECMKKSNKKNFCAKWQALGTTYLVNENRSKYIGFEHLMIWPSAYSYQIRPHTDFTPLDINEIREGALVYI